MWATGASFAEMELEVKERRRLSLLRREGVDATMRHGLFVGEGTLDEGGDGWESDDSDDELFW
jgi:hypothetical protein